MSKILNDGKTSYFLPIDELRDAFNSRGFDNEIFDFLIETLRDNGTIVLHQNDESIAGAEKAAKFFTDSNGFTFGTFSVENINALMEAVQNAVANEEVISQPNVEATPVTTQTDEISEPKLRKLNEDEMKPISDSLRSAFDMAKEKKTSNSIKKATGWEKISDEEWCWTGKNDRNQDVKAAYFPRGNEHRKTKDKFNSLIRYNKAQIKAILEAPAGTKIHQVHHAVATTESDFEIVMRGMSEKGLIRVNKNGSHNRSKKLSRQLLNDVFFNSEATLFYPIAKTAEEIAKDEADLFETLELSMKQNDVENTESQMSELQPQINQEQTQPENITVEQELQNTETPEQKIEATPKQYTKTPRSENVTDLDSLIARNKEAEPEFHELMKELQTELGGELKERTEMKKAKRINEKVETDYNGDFSRVVDVWGGSLIFDNEQDLLNALKKLEARNDVIRLKNKWNNPDDSGYRDINANLMLPNGVVVELQLHHRGIIGVKEEKFGWGIGHLLYDFIRNPKHKGNPDMKGNIEKVKQLSREIYQAGIDGSVTQINANAKASLSEIALALSSQTSAREAGILVNDLSELMRKTLAPNSSSLHSQAQRDETLGSSSSNSTANGTSSPFSKNLNIYNTSNINKNDAILPQKGKIIKGRASWEKDVPLYEQTALIELSEKHKDPTTIIEELGHYFLQWDIDALRFGGKETLKEDIDEVMKFAGVTFEDYQNDTDGAREKVQEAYAKEFIKYAATGEAPNSRLKRAFQRFKAWMFDLFRDMQRRNVHVNENMRRVFDNLFTNQKKVDYSAKIKDFAIEAAALKNEISRAEAMLRERAERESAYAEMMEDTLPEISKNALQNVSEYLMNQIRFVSDQLKYNDDVLRIANTIKSLGGLRYQDIEQAIGKPLAQDLRKKWPSLFRKQQGNEQLPLDTLVQQFEDSGLNFHNNNDLINWLTDTNNEKPKPVAPLIEINTDNLNALIDVLGIEETKNYVKTRKNYVNKLTKAAEAELDKSKIKVSDAEIDIAELEWTMKTSKGKGKSSKINAKLKKANEALKKAKSDYALAQKDVQELYKEQTEISDSLDFINRVLNADGEAIGIENEAAEKPTAEKTNKPTQQKQLLTLSEAMKKGYQMADRYYKEGVNAEKELEQIRLDRMEDRFEAKIDRLKKHLNRDQIRIEKLRSRLEEIGKIKPEINRIVKSINSMKNKINIRYGRKKEIEELLSKYDLKRRSKNTLSHRDDVEVFLRAYPESIEQMTEPEDLEALKLAGKINIGNMTLGELRALENKVEEIYDKGEREYKEWKTAKDETRKKIREDLEKSLNKKSVSKSGVPTKRKDLEKQYKGVSGKLDKIKDWNSATLRTPDRVADILDGGGAKYNGAWEKHLIEEPREKINEAERHIHERKDKMEQELAKLGLKLVDFSKALTKLDDKTFTVDEVIELYLGMRNPKKAKAILFGNFVNRLNCSPEEAQNMINELTSHLTENHKKAAELIIADHEANKERINQSLIDARNEGMNFESDYTSVHRLEHRTNGGFIDVNDEEVIRNGMNEAGLLQRIDNGFAISRQNISDQNQTPIQLGAFSNWLSDISKQENSAALNETASNLMSALLSKGENGKTLLQTISDKFGDQMKKAVVSIFNDTFTDNRRIADEFLRGVSAAASRNMSVAYIAGNIGVYVMQATSYPLFLPFARPDYLFTSIFEFLQNPDEFLENVYQLSPSMRVTGGDPIDRAFLDSINNTKWQSSMNKLLQPTSQIDNITKSMGWWAVYKTNLKRGVPHEKAIREADKAVRLTQPPSSAKDTMRIARSGGLAALKMKFTSATAAFWNLTTYDFVQQLTRNGLNGVKSAFYTALGLGVTAVALKMMHDGGPKEEEGQSIPEWTMEAFIDQFIGSWPLIGKDAMYAHNKYFRGKWGQPQIDAFSAPISKAFEALGILMKEDKEDKDWMKALSLGAEVTALTTGKIPYAGIKQALRSIILFGNGDPLGGILNSIGFRQKASGE
ncbi:MAG: hypothetical protein IJQ99_07715 [Synergistaceae bacterium]|nr:hypothetical protein [Synergistaceae bacterium]